MKHSKELDIMFNKRTYQKRKKAQLLPTITITSINDMTDHNKPLPPIQPEAGTPPYQPPFSLGVSRPEE